MNPCPVLTVLRPPISSRDAMMPHSPQTNRIILNITVAASKQGISVISYTASIRYYAWWDERTTTPTSFPVCTYLTKLLPVPGSFPRLAFVSHPLKNPAGRVKKWQRLPQRPGSKSGNDGYLNTELDYYYQRHNTRTMGECAGFRNTRLRAWANHKYGKYPPLLGHVVQLIVVPHNMVGQWQP